MKIEVDKELCTACKTCVEMCPEEVLEMNGDQPVMAQPDDCIECGSCEVNCEEGALKCIEE